MAKPRSYLCDLFFIFSLIFIAINSISTLNRGTCFFAHFLEYLLLFLDGKMYQESE